jgi:hypothetical protein
MPSTKEKSMTQSQEDQNVVLKLIWENNKATQLPISVQDASIPALIRRAEVIATHGVDKTPGRVRLPQMILYENTVLYRAGQPPIDSVPVIVDEDDLTEPRSVEVSNDKGHTWEFFEGPFDEKGDLDASMMAARAAGYRYCRVSS